MTAKGDDTVEQVKFVTLLQSDLPRKLMCGPLSKKSRFELHVEGFVGVPELENLLRIVQLQIDFLREDAPPPPPSGDKDNG